MEHPSPIRQWERASRRTRPHGPNVLAPEGRSTHCDAENAASKAAVESLGRSLRIEVHHKGVDVGVAYYSFLDTPMVDAMTTDPAAMRARAAMPAPVRQTDSLEAAVEATVTGIQRRADRVIYPRFLRAQVLLRLFLGPRSEGAWRKAMLEVERLSHEADDR